MKALILAAGYATRMYPLTKDYPKSLLMIRQKPIINYIIDKLQTISDLNEIVVITNHKFIFLFRKWVKRVHSQKRIGTVDDLTCNPDDRLGAIGDINFTINKKHIKEDLLVIGGDNLFNHDLSYFISFAKANKPNPVIGVYDIKNMDEAKKYGLIKLNRKNRVVDFQEKPKSPKSTLVAMCLYYFPKERLHLVKEYLDEKRHKDDATGFYIDWLRKTIPVYGVVFDGFWYDIGDRKFYKEAKQKFK